MESLVSTEWLAAEIGAPGLRVLDATFFLPAEGRDARAEFAEAHIPSAAFMDLSDLVDRSHPAPGMLPSPHEFASAMAQLGVSHENRIVVYDNSPHRSSARAWWMFKSFGVGQVALLDGGFRKWTAEGRPVEQGRPAKSPARFIARLDPQWLAHKEDVVRLLPAQAHRIVDARSAARFTGTDPEPRAGVVPGHIPGSHNLPQSLLFNSDNSFKRGDALRAAFSEAGIDLKEPLIATCGSGVTAAVLLFGAQLLGKTDVRLYDGSWAEWGSDPATPKAVGCG